MNNNMPWGLHRASQQEKGAFVPAGLMWCVHPVGAPGHSSTPSFEGRRTALIHICMMFFPLLLFDTFHNPLLLLFFFLLEKSDICWASATFHSLFFSIWTFLSGSRNPVRKSLWNMKSIKQFNIWGNIIKENLSVNVWIPMTSWAHLIVFTEFLAFFKNTQGDKFVTWSLKKSVLVHNNFSFITFIYIHTYTLYLHLFITSDKEMKCRLSGRENSLNIYVWVNSFQWK